MSNLPPGCRAVDVEIAAAGIYAEHDEDACPRCHSTNVVELEDGSGRECYECLYFMEGAES